MAAPITTFVDITTVVGGAAATKFSFGALMGVFEHNIVSERQAGPYFTLAELVAAGFTSIAAPAIHAWATTVFAQDDGVDQLLIGRRIPVAGGIAQQVWQVDDSLTTFVDMTTEFNGATDADFIPFPAVEGNDDYVAIGFPETFGQVIFDGAAGTAGIGGTVTWQYLNSAGVWTALAGVADGTTGFTTAVADGQTLTFTVPSDWSAQTLNAVSAFYIRAVITGVYATNPIYDQGFVGTDANLTVSMDAIELADPDSWYITNIATRTDAEIALIGAWTEARDKIGIVQSPDLALVAATALNGLSYNRTALWYHADSTAYLDGGISSSGGGINTDIAEGSGIWAYRTLEGVTFDAVTGAQATAIYAVNANLYGRNLGLSFSSQATMASGRFIDVQVTLDWIERRLQEALLAMFVNANKVPYTNGGINLVRGVTRGVLSQGVTFGHLSIEENQTIVLPDISAVSQDNKTARILPYTINVELAGAIQQAVITVNVTL